MFSENLAPSVVRKLVKEITELVSSPHEGIKVLFNEENVTDVQALIFGPEGTPYQNGVFRIKLILSSDFPNQPPKGYFLTKIFHPNVSKTGEICVNTLKKDWKKELGISSILLTIKCLLIVPNAESALNEEAGKLLLEDYESYCSHARMMTSIHALASSSSTSANVSLSTTAITTSSSSSSSSYTSATKHSATTDIDVLGNVDSNSPAFSTASSSPKKSRIDVDLLSASSTTKNTPVIKSSKIIPEKKKMMKRL